MYFPKPEIVEALRKEYSAGTRVELVAMDDPQAPSIGTKGTVTGVDDVGTIHIDWDNGGSLGAVYGYDFIRKVDK